jgi:hypothetical protein
MSVIVPTGVALLLLFSCACRGSHSRGTATPDTPRATLPRLALGTRFVPPQDGLLTDAQIDRYLRVRRAAKGRTEEETARALGTDLDEVAWVRARILEAIVALDTRRLRSASEETYSRAIASLKQTRDSMRDKESQRTLNEQIAALERERASLKGLEALPAEIATNTRRVAARRQEIDAVGP